MVKFGRSDDGAAPLGAGGMGKDVESAGSTEMAAVPARPPSRSTDAGDADVAVELRDWKAMDMVVSGAPAAVSLPLADGADDEKAELRHAAAGAGADLQAGENQRASTSSDPSSSSVGAVAVPRPPKAAAGEERDVVPDAIGHETCPICIVDFEEGDDLRVLPCEGHHRFHQECVDQWLLELSSSCPICRQGGSCVSLPLRSLPPPERC